LPQDRGYTLIEVLVAMTIFAVMVGLATMAFDQSLTQYRGLVEKGINFWGNARNLMLCKSFDCASDYYVRDSSGKWSPYFHGNQDLISYVTLSPLVADVPVVVWIVKEALDDGRFNVLYYELPVYTKTRQEIERDYVFGDYKKGQAFKLLEKIDQLDISFYAYDVTKGAYAWVYDFEGEKRVSLPITIKMSYVRGGKKSAMFFGIKTNSPRKQRYNRVYAQ
jgi:general secretion pathway protein J